MPFDIESAKSLFFDRAPVKSAVDAGTRRALSKFGAFVRTRSRSSIRKRKKASKPGQPPSSHVGLLKKFLFFGFDPAAKSVVTGPVLAGPRSGAPETLEDGGPATVREAVPGGGRKASSPAQARAYRRLLGDGRLSAPARQFTTRQIHVRPRPYMLPAFKAELPKAAQVFKDAIR